MYKLVIVEDEESIRSSLEKYIPWGLLGFEVVGVFADGMEAIDFIRRNPCDAVLTDIMMNMMNGLEMTSILCDSFPMIKVVVLSGYNRFDYAQQAIHYRVSAYLLKPVDEDELISVFQTIKEELDKERMELKFAKIEEQELRRVLQHNFIINLTERRLDTKEDIMIYLKFLRLPEICVDCPIFVLKVKITKETESDRQGENAHGAIYRELKEQFDRNDDLFQGIVIDRQDDTFNVMILGMVPDADRIRAAFEQSMNELIQNLKDTIGCGLSYSVKNSAERMSAFLRKQIRGEEKDKQLQQEDMKIGCYQRIVMEYKLLMVEMDLGNLCVLQHLIDGVFSDLRDNSVKEVRFLMKNMFSSIAMEYEKRKIAIWDITGEGYELDKLQSFENIEEMKVFVIGCLFAISNGIKNIDSQNERGIVEKIKEYLESHIGDEIVHDALASKFRIHPGYMSRLFKQTIGETVSGYLFRRRMETAVALLQNENYMVSEVAERIGYPNASYFSFLFNKYTGYTPKEFRQRVLS